MPCVKGEKTPAERYCQRSGHRLSVNRAGEAGSKEGDSGDCRVCLHKV